MITEPGLSIVHPFELQHPDPAAGRRLVLERSEWRALILVWVCIGVSLMLTQALPVAAGIWYAGWVVWSIFFRRGLMLPALLCAAVPVPHNVFPVGVNLSVVEVGLVIAGVFAIASVWRRMGPIALPVTAYLVFCFISMAVSFRGNAAVTSLIQTGVYLVLAVVVFGHYARDSRQLLIAVVALMGTSLFLSMVNLSQGGGGYVFGIHKNSLGATTSAATVCAMAVWLHLRQTRKPRLWTWVLVILSLGLFMTLSRGAWVAAVVGGICLAGVYRQWRVVFLLMCIALPVGLLGYFLLPESQQAYVLGSVDSTSHSYGTRSHNAELAWDFFKQSPILGSGLGIRKQADATNIVLFTLAETGFLGLLAFMWIHFNAGRSLMRSYRVARPGSLTLMVTALGMALIFGRLAHGLVDHYWSRGAISVAWGMVGAAIALHRLKKRSVYTNDFID